MKNKNRKKLIRKAGLVAGLAAVFTGISMCAPTAVTFAEENVTSAESDKLKEIEELKAKKEEAQAAYDVALRDKLLAEDELENARRAVSDAEAEYEDVWERYSTGFAGFLRWVIETEEDPVKVEDAKQVLAATFAEDTQVSADDSANITRMLYMADWLEEQAEFFRMNYRIEAGTSHAAMSLSQSGLNAYNNYIESGDALYGDLDMVYNDVVRENEKLASTTNAGSLKGLWLTDSEKQATEQDGMPLFDDWEKQASGLPYNTSIFYKRNGYQYGEYFIETFEEGEGKVLIATNYEGDELPVPAEGFYEEEDEYPEAVLDEGVFEEDDVEEDFFDNEVMITNVESYEKWPVINSTLGVSKDLRVRVETDGNIYTVYNDEYPYDGSIIMQGVQGEAPVKAGIYKYSELNIDEMDLIPTDYYYLGTESSMNISRDIMVEQVLETRDNPGLIYPLDYTFIFEWHILEIFNPAKGITIGEALGVNAERGENVVMGAVFNGEGTYTIDEYVSAIREYCAMTDPLAARSVLAQRNDDFDNASRQLAGAEETLLAAGGRLKGAEKEYEEAVAGLAGLVAAEETEDVVQIASANEVYAAENISVEEGTESVTVRYSAESPTTESVTSSNVNLSAESPVTESVTALSEQSPAWSGDTVFDASVNETYSPEISSETEKMTSVNDSATEQEAIPEQMSIKPEASTSETFAQPEIQPVKAADEIKTEEGLLQTDKTDATEPEKQKPNILAEVLSYIFNGGAIAVILPTGFWRKKRAGDILHGERV